MKKGLVLNNLPTIIEVENNEAQFTIKGGLNVIPVIATGLKSYQYPAMHEKIGVNWELVHIEHNTQSDGNQMFCDKDGKFGAVFLVRTNGEAREFRIKANELLPNFKRIEIQPKLASTAEVSIVNQFENLPLTLKIDNQVFPEIIKWNESEGKSFWYQGSIKDTLSGARITGFEDQVAIQYWWQNGQKGNLSRSPKFELEIGKNLPGSKFKVFYYNKGQMVEYNNLKKAATIQTTELSYSINPGIIVLYNPELDYCLAISFKNAASVFVKKNSIGVNLSLQNCHGNRRKVMEGNVYLMKGNSAMLQQKIEQEMPVWKQEVKN